MQGQGLPPAWRANDRELYIVTGADGTHARSLVQLLHSIALHERRIRVVVYDLGLTDVQRSAVYGALVNGTLERFRFEDYPSFFDIKVNAGEYAWKPVIVAAEIAKSPSPVCWMDAGNQLHSRVHGIRTAVRRDGFYLPESRGSFRRWVHPDMMAELGLPPDSFADRKNLNAACIAFDPARPLVKELVRQWAACAERREVIAPDGSNRSNHRQDQALLTVLAYKLGVLSEPSETVRELRIHRDID